MAPVAIGEWMDGDQAVMEAHGDFVGRIAGVLNLVMNVIQQFVY